MVSIGLKAAVIDLSDRVSRRLVVGMFCCILIGVPFIIGCLLVLGLIPLYLPNHSSGINRYTTIYTDMLRMQYSANISFNDSFDSIDKEALGKALDETMGFEPNTMLVLEAEFLSDADDQSTERSRRHVSSRDVSQRTSISSRNQLNMYCQARSPARCTGSSYCQESFKQQTLSKISNQRYCSLPISCSKVIIVIQVSLNIFIENCRPTCTDNVKNQNETDIDCGGGNCPACADKKRCKISSDCYSDVCNSSICQVPTCTDNVKNQNETDIDCGAPSCPTCIDGKRCNVSSECRSGVCKINICQVPTCTDNVKNQNETDKDCGGNICPACLDGKQCNAGKDCLGGVCNVNICHVATCMDNVKNQDETDKDCGGHVCPKCVNGKGCNATSDCVSGVCSGSQCQVPTCNDNVKNQNETDKDCGGNVCPKCVNGKGCNATSDCVSAVCTSNICQAPTCSDNVKNQNETDKDCGGNVCPKCVNGKGCNATSDCISGVCSENQCQVPTCSDNVKNQNETDKDCGGSACPKCVNGKKCNATLDCVSAVCTSNICQAPTCSDNVQNQDETDKDCGGNVCPKCVDGKGCNSTSDCVSGVCSGKKCQVATCSDNVKNQNESDKDCGGVCPVCVNGKACNIGSDCASTVCTLNVCQSCSLNSFVNGGFESGNANGWTLGGGSRSGINSSAIVSNNYKPGGSKYNSTIASTHSAIVTSGNDPIIGAALPNIVHRGNYSWRVEDLDINAYLSVISQQINSYYCTDIYFAWLAVLENGGHIAEQSSIMLITLKDATVGDTLLSRLYNAGAGSGGVDSRFSVQGSYYYTPAWQIEHLSINSSRIGHNFTLDVLVADCSLGGHRGYLYIDSFGGVAP